MQIYEKPNKLKQARHKTENASEAKKQSSEPHESQKTRIYSEQEVQSSNKSEFFRALGFVGAILSGLSHTAATCARVASTNPVLLSIGIGLMVVGFALAWYFHI